MQFCETEVQQLCAGFRQHNVAGLEIAMRDPPAMSDSQSTSNLDGVLQRLLNCQRAFGEPGRQGLSLQVLHHQEVDAVLVADIVQRTNVRMIQRSNGSGFALEAFTKIFF